MIGTSNAGYEIIAAIPSIKAAGVFIVTAARSAPGSAKVHYVTWETDGKGNFYWGDEVQGERRDALANMIDRAGMTA